MHNCVHPQPQRTANSCDFALDPNQTPISVDSLWLFWPRIGRRSIQTRTLGGCGSIAADWFSQPARQTDVVSGSISDKEDGLTAAATAPDHGHPAGRLAAKLSPLLLEPRPGAHTAPPTCTPRCGLAVTKAVRAEPPGRTQRQRLPLCSAVTPFLPPPTTSMEQLERDPRSEDDEADYEEEEVDPRIQVG